MGAWGTDPVESDQGQEFYADALAGLQDKIRHGLRSAFSQQVRAAAFLLERVGFIGVYPGELDIDLEQAIDRLRELLRDDDEAASWNDAVAWRRGVEQQVLALEERRVNLMLPGTRTLASKLGIRPDGTLGSSNPSQERAKAARTTGRTYWKTRRVRRKPPSNP